MNMQSRVGGTVAANGRSYRFPKQPTVVVCIDEGDGTAHDLRKKPLAKGTIDVRVFGQTRLRRHFAIS